MVTASGVSRLTRTRGPFGRFLLDAPSREGVDLGRDRSPMRDVAL